MIEFDGKRKKRNYHQHHEPQSELDVIETPWVHSLLKAVLYPIAKIVHKRYNILNCAFHAHLGIKGYSIAFLSDRNGCDKVTIIDGSFEGE